MFPERGVQVTLVGFDRGAVTNDQGFFRLKIPSIFKPGDEIKFNVAKEGWRVPLDGAVRIPSDLQKEWVRLETLPLGSPGFLTPASIEKLIEDALRKSAQQAGAKNVEPKLDFSRAIREWAERYGLSPDSAKAEIDQWIAEVKEANGADERRLGLAAFAEQQFEKAAGHFGQGRRS